jgi:hypothetical protein
MSFEKEALETLAPENVEQIYFNGFKVSLSAGDILISLLRNGRNVLVLNSSFTVSKSLAEKLAEVISFLEANLDSNIYNIDKINEAVEKGMKAIESMKK